MVRTLTYALLILGDHSATTDTLARAFALHCFLLAITAIRWPVISIQARLSVTVQAGEDALGRLREAG